MTWPGEVETAVLPRIEGPAVASPEGAETAVLPRIDGPVVASTGDAAARGWWRRNRWGVLALLPALALALGPAVRQGYEQMTRAEPRRAVVPGPDGWVTYAGSRMRLAELTSTTELTGRDGRPFPLPAGVRAWRATVLFEPDTPEGVVGCSVWLEDSDGRLSSAGPAELLGAGVLAGGCGPERDAGGRPYEKVFYFVLPESSSPVAARVVTTSMLPRYAQLSAG
ncbi:hypothetical protein I0C86_01090 [Plantactinospora sp. S1510]|uniref:DUF4179 domain-containing protein n=1 Tax=Plantactinospora alkalitolerans TaxID=2789879 RepID=A0ABS0GNM9_9ACTN|nr:hypothetical protein [Plantactinospora alkalitolerans]MBF9127598.1 hypothetical protein [Plantactinospora alkalitolerans]